MLRKLHSINRLNPKMADAKQHKFKFISQTNEPYYDKARVKISMTGQVLEFHSRHFKNPKIRDKYVTVRLGWTHLSLISVSSNVSHFACVWPKALKLGSITNVNMLFLMMDSLVWLVILSLC